jgi:hypothetical protein
MPTNQQDPKSDDPIYQPKQSSMKASDSNWTIAENPLMMDADTTNTMQQ